MNRREFLLLGLAGVASGVAVGSYASVRPAVGHAYRSGVADGANVVALRCSEPVLPKTFEYVPEYGWRLLAL